MKVISHISDALAKLSMKGVPISWIFFLVRLRKRDKQYSYFYAMSIFQILIVFDEKKKCFHLSYSYEYDIEFDDEVSCGRHIP